MDDLQDIPKYIYDDENERIWLTFSATITGKWIAGYSRIDGAFIESPLVESADSLLDAIHKLRAEIKSGKL